MSKFTRLEYTQLIVFCLYWFVFFPIIWFVVKPDFFVSSIWYAILFAVILLLIYYLLYFIIKRCCQPKESTTETKRFWPEPASRRNGHNPSVYTPTTTNGNRVSQRESRILIPDAVMYENVPPPNKKQGLVCQEEPFVDEERKNVRFITSCSLYYDGQNFN